MAQSRPSVLKRQRERARMEKKRMKAEKKASRDAEREELDGPAIDPGIDADIAHIVPGPQALPEQFDYAPDVENE